jgi:hypothetical protein
VCPQYPHISLDLVFPRHFAVFPLHEIVVAPLIVCLLSSRCVSRGNFSDKWHGAICATTSNDNDFLNAHGWTLLLKNSTYGAANIRFFIMSHNAYTATGTFVTYL